MRKLTLAEAMEAVDNKHGDGSYTVVSGGEEFYVTVYVEPDGEITIMSNEEDDPEDLVVFHGFVKAD